MITRVLLENFRSHQHTDLQIDSPVVAFIGDNDSGKSTILDAISSTCLGDPWEDVRPKDKTTGELIDCGPTHVRIEWQNGQSLDRWYDGKKYRTLLQAADGSVLMDAKTLPDVRDTVREFTGLMPLKDRNDNIYPQLEELDEGPFLLAPSTPQALQRRLTAIVPGASLQAAVSSLTLELAARQKAVTEAGRLYTEAKTEADRVKSELETVEPHLKALETEEARLQQLQITRQTIRDAVEFLDEQTTVVDTLQGLVKKMRKVPLQAATDALQKLRTIKTKFQNFETLSQQRAKATAHLAGLRAIVEIDETLQYRRGFLTALQDLRTTIEQKLTELDHNETQLELMEQQLTQKKAALAQLPVCTECGQYL